VLKSNLALRVLTAAVALPFVLGLLFWGPPLGWYGLIFIATGIAASELFLMTHPGDRIAQAAAVVTTLVTSAGVYWGANDARMLLSVMFGVTIVGMLLPLWRLGEIRTAGMRIMSGVAGPLYVGALLCTSALLRRDFGPGHVLLTLMLAWCADTGGYFFGRFLGKRKLYEAVSPKKTVAGFVGAIVGAASGALLGHFWYVPTLPMWDAILLGIVAGALGQLGDLVESLLKRSTNIKDSGSIMPGHGGLLDRIDALLVVSPIVYLYWLW
jgi:phosphatidate cytidylyltransferase